MKIFCFTLISVFATFWAELALANAGVFLPLMMLQVFYITVVRKWKLALISAFIMCSSIDSMLDVISLPSMFVVVICASFWRSLGDCSRSEMQFLPLLFTLLPSLLVLFLLNHYLNGGLWNWSHFGIHFSIALFGGAFAAPFFIYVQDMLAAALKISTYTDIQREELYRASDY